MDTVSFLGIDELTFDILLFFLSNELSRAITDPTICPLSLEVCVGSKEEISVISICSVLSIVSEIGEESALSKD